MTPHPTTLSPDKSADKAHATGSPLAADAAQAAAQPLPNKTFWQLLNLSIGFLGIQFAWALQMGQMSPLLESLGSVAWLTSLIWCAGPVTGIVVQPIVGSWSDNTMSLLGRRRPFLLAGAILTAVCLVLMPSSPTWAVAALLLWILDASINVSQGPYRALVPDVVPKAQQASTYALMSFTIGLGSVAAFYIGGSDIAQIREAIAQTVATWGLAGPAHYIQNLLPDRHFLFYLGAISILAAMGWTILTTPEIPQTKPSNTASEGFWAFIRKTWHSILEMPTETKKLCLMHSFTWFGWQCLFIFFSLYVIHNLVGTTDPTSPLYQQGVQKASYGFFILNLVCFLVSPFLGRLCSIFSKKAVHTFGLLCFGLALLSSYFLHSPEQAHIAMGFIGVGWATTLSIPFALLAQHIPTGKEGVLMGTFNIFIAAPQFVASALAGFLVTLTHNDATALMLGGISVLISAFLLQWVQE